MDRIQRNQNDNKDNENINSPPPIDASAELIMSDGGLKALIKISPPANGGVDLTYDALENFLAEKKIIFGVDTNALKSLSEYPLYNAELIVARGIPAEAGKDAEIIYHIDTDRKLKPKEREDGSVDFKELGTVHEVKKGDLLCEKKPLTEGTTGTTVTDKTISTVSGRDKALPAGKNTVFSDDKLQLLAATDGHISIIGGKINILDVFTVKGNVSTETGNINFTGNIVVKGDVTRGFTVQATGDITVDGAVEKATVVAGGSLIIRGGFHGGENGSLTAGDNITCRFVEGGSVTVKNNLETTYVMNSEVKCGGEVRLSGKGLIRGGYVMARKSVTANFLGSGNSSTSSTIIEVGNDPLISSRLAEVSKEIEVCKKNISNLELMINTLTQQKNEGRLVAKKAESLKQAEDFVARLKIQSVALGEEYEMLQSEIAEIGYGTVNVRRSAYPNLKIVIGPDVLVLKNEYSYTTFSRSNEGIIFTAMTK